MMNVKHERLDLREGVFKSEPDLVLKRTSQKSEDEHGHINFDELKTNTLGPGKNDKIKQEIIKCEETANEQLSDLLPKLDHDSMPQKCVKLFPTIKKQLDNTNEVKDMEVIELKEEVSEHVEFKAELLTTHCDLPTLKNENTEYPDCSTESCAKEEDDMISKYFLASNSRSNHLDEHVQEDLVVCKFCGKSLKKINLQHHLIIHRKLFNCDICSKKFTRKSSLQTHLIIHTDEKPFKCEICSKGFKSKSNLRQHLFTHTSEKTLKNNDSKGFSDKQNCQPHLITQTHEKPFKCDICSKRYNYKYNLQQHLIIHTNEKPFKCNICSNEFTRKFSLQKHLITHTNRTLFNCDICSKKFTRKSGLKTHLIIHNNKKPSKSDVCSNEFNQKSSVQKHLIAHTNRKIFNCDICSKKFTQKSSLRTHLIIHTNEKPFKCDICSKGFNDKSNLRQHLITHTNEKPIKYHKEFNDKHNLQQYLITRTHEKLFKCDICTKEFKDKSCLQQHLLIHTNDICSNEITEKSSLQTHLINHTDLISGQTLFRTPQKREMEHVDVFDEFNANTFEPRQNVDKITQDIIGCEEPILGYSANAPEPGQNFNEIKHEMIECVEPKIELPSDLLSKIDHDSVPPKNVKLFHTTIKREPENTSQFNDMEFVDLKEDIEYVEFKAEL